jgi:hypothetical protein
MTQIEQIDKQQLLRFLELEAELQHFQGGKEKIEYEVLVDFIRADNHLKEEKI